MIKVQVDTRDVQLALQDLQARVNNLKPVLGDIGEYLIVSTRERFAQKKAPDGTPWKKNSPVTQKIKGRDDALVGDSKSLSRYFDYVLSKNSLTFGSKFEYAALQHHGARQGQFGKSKRGGPLPWGNIPARPFIGLSRDDNAAVKDIISEFLAKHKK